MLVIDMFLVLMLNTYQFFLCDKFKTDFNNTFQRRLESLDGVDIKIKYLRRNKTMERTKEQNMNSGTMLIVVLSMSAMMMLNNSVLMPMLGNIKETYPNVSDLLLQGVLTLPAITIMLSMLLARYLTRYFSPKKVIIAGFIIFTVAGAALSIPMPFASFITLRLVFGIGIGLTNPFVNTLMVNYFTGDRQTKLMGYTGGIKVLVGTLATAIAGILAVYDWHYAPLLYAMALIPLAATLIGMDNEMLPEVKKGKHPIKSLFTSRINTLLFSQMLFVLIDFVYLANIALVLGERHIAATETSSYLLVGFNIITIILSALFFPLFKRLGRNLMYVSSFSVCIAFALFATGDSFSMMMLGSLFMGAPTGLLAPLLVREINEAIVNPETTMTIFTASSICIFLGQFVSPIVVAILCSMLPISGTTGAFTVGFILTIVQFITLLYYFKIMVPKYEQTT